MPNHRHELFRKSLSEKWAGIVERDSSLQVRGQGLGIRDQCPMAPGRSTEIISLVKWIRTSRLAIKNILARVQGPGSGG